MKHRVHFESSSDRMNGSSSGVGNAATSSSSSSSSSAARLSRLKSECSANVGPALPGVGRSPVPSASSSASARPVLGALKQAQRQSVGLERALSSTPASSARRGQTPFGFDGPSTPTPTSTYEAAATATASAAAAAPSGPAGGGAARRGGDVRPNNPFSSGSAGASASARDSVVELASNPFREAKQTQTQAWSTSTSLGPSGEFAFSFSTTGWLFLFDVVREQRLFALVLNLNNEHWLQQ